jgi:hypothetical protein
MLTSPADRRKQAARLGMLLLVLLYVVATFAVLVLVSELFLADMILGPTEASSRPSAAADELVRRGYYPDSVKVDPYHEFEELYPHPTYGYYWPMSGGRVLARSNGAVTLDHHGFRGRWSPTNRLAFLLGGSAAFGYRASGDETTITGWLNKLQGGLQFVNAGVVGATSASEAARLEEQIVAFKPHLVVSYTLFNDIEQTIESLEAGPGGSEWGRRLVSLAPKTARLLEASRERYLPQRAEDSDYEPPAQLLESAVDSAVDKFIRNQERMRALSLEKRFRFVTVIQPMTQTHRKAAISGPYPELYRRAVRRALASDYCRSHCLDYSGIFDEFFDTIPVVFKDYNVSALEDATDLRDVVFADWCHQLDAGNAIVARKLVKSLALEGAG